MCIRDSNDVAFLRVEAMAEDLRHVAPVELACSVAAQGQWIAVMGHGVFGPSKNMQSSVSAGIVSKVVRKAIVQTSARVFRGDSGGMLLDRQGKFAGMVTSNGRDDEQVYPTVNFSIPSTLLARVVRAGLSDAGVRQVAADIDGADTAHVRRLWAFENTEERQRSRL